MSSTLVIILSETRASELTFDNFKKNVIDELNADLCVCIGVKPDYDYNDPFYKLAKYKFTYNEPDDYGEAFDYAYKILSKDLPKYEKIDNMNAFYAKIRAARKSDDKITYLGDKPINLKKLNYNIISVHNKEFSNKNWSNQAYASNMNDLVNYTEEKDVTLYKKPLYWKELLSSKDIIMGGIKQGDFLFPGSAGILIFYRWFLLQKLIENDLINKYDRFIITRSDFIYQLPHPKVELMSENCIWVPYGEIVSKHVVLSKKNIELYLNIMNNFVLKSNDYFIKMIYTNILNLENLINFHLEQNNALHCVKEFPNIMFSVRNKNGKTRGSPGIYSTEFGFYIKYQTEYDKSNYYNNEFKSSSHSLFDFYKKHIYIRKNYNIKTPIALNLLDTEILNEYKQDLDLTNINCFLDGTNKNSYNQIPDICKKYMNYKDNNFEMKWSKEMIDDMLDCCNKYEYVKMSPKDYPNASLQFVEVFNKFVNLSGKNSLVLGSISPWVECLLLHFNAKSVTTLDYITPDCDYKINTISMDDYIKKKTKYDVIISFSSLEHDGLGRYGDPINPNGDIDACIEAYDMLNNGGYFICGIPIGAGVVYGNYHRIYNKKRVAKLFSLFDEFIGSVNYQTLDNSLNYVGCDWQNQPIFVYKK
jgi:hypothetical protein